LYGIALLALGAVLAFGVEIRGTTGWLSVGGFSAQPVELVKLLFIIYLARFFSDRSDRMHQWKNIGYACLIGGVPAALVLLQPDLGSALMIVAIWLGMLLISGIKRWQFGLIVVLMAGLAVVAFFGFLTSEQKSRLLVFVNCETSECRLGVGYNVEQSITAIGSGQWIGRGLGLGSQSQLDFLPEQETDFIFAVIAEEFGFLGAATVVVLIATVLFRIARAASLVRDDFAVFLCWGIFMFIFVQSVINIGMNLGLAPVTGLPLPLISAGGTSVIAVLAGLGVVESVVLRRNQLG
jgi:rod shape determining protein RodA